MHALNPIDLLFLSLEKKHQPMHIGGLFLFKLPDHAPKTFVSDLLQEIRQNHTIPLAPFNQITNGLFWKDDPDFDIEQHIRHIALPAPGRIRELFVYISQEHSLLLNRARPLWICHIIEGIEGNRFAMYIKMHHAMVDGIAAIRLVEKSLATSPDVRHITPIWNISQLSRTQHHKTRPSLAKKALHLLKTQSQAMPAAIRELSHAIRYERGKHADYVSTLQAPKSLLNQRISPSRRFAAQSYDLVCLQKIAKAQKTTINDVILAMCSGAIRRYLLNLNALPQKPLIAMVPTSMRRDQSAHGNQITMILANLATDQADPLTRLQTIHASTQYSKKRFQRLNTAQVFNYSALTYAFTGLNVITGLVPTRQPFNIVISNVPGPSQPLYCNGAVLEALYPASVIFDGQALNITLTSYLDKLEVGIVACQKSLPHIQSLLKLLAEELQLLAEKSGIL